MTETPDGHVEAITKMEKGTHHNPLTCKTRNNKEFMCTNDEGHDAMTNTHLTAVGLFL